MKHIKESGRTIWRGAKKFGKTNGRRGVKIEDVEGYLLANWDKVTEMLDQQPPAVKKADAIGCSSSRNRR
jgi:hypothetical protein